MQSAHFTANQASGSLMRQVTELQAELLTLKAVKTAKDELAGDSNTAASRQEDLRDSMKLETEKNLRSQLEAALAEVDDLRQKLEGHNTMLSTRRDAETDALREELEEAEQAAASWKNERGVIQQKMREMEEICRRLEDEATSAQTELQAASKRLADLEKAREAWEIEKAELEEFLEGSSLREAALQEAIDAAAERERAWESQNQAEALLLQEEVVAGALVTTAIDEAKVEVQEVVELRAQLRAAQDEIAKLKLGADSSDGESNIGSYGELSCACRCQLMSQGCSESAGCELGTSYGCAYLCAAGP